MRKTIKLYFLSIIIIFSLLPIPYVRADWLEGWDQRVKITIDKEDIDNALNDFPILIYISSSSGINNKDITFVFDEVGANSLKIAVTRSDGTTECYVEVEEWDLGNEKAWLWAKIPSISHSMDTDIYLYFDNDHVDNTAYIGLCADGSVPTEQVWNNGFIAVYHLKDEATNTILDSTSSDLDGVKTEANGPEEVSGFIGPAQEFDPNEAISLDNFGGPYTTLTLEVWFQADDTDNNRAIFTLGEPDNQLDRAFINLGSDRLYSYWRTDGVTVNPFITWTDEVNWHYIATTREGTAIKGYPDGILDVGLNGVVGTGTIQDLRQCWIGSYSVGGNYFDGTIDESRVSNIVRNSAWIKATYETGRDDLLDFGSKEITISPPSDPNLLFGAGFNDSSPYVELHWNHSLIDVELFEVQNSTDNISWTYLGQSTTANYTDIQVVNGTYRYYKVRACNNTDDTWYNSSFSNIDMEKVYFIPEVGNGIGEPSEDYASLFIVGLILGLIIGIGASRS